MWPRVVEFMLGVWLLLSPFIFGHPEERVAYWANDWACACLVMTFAAASYWRPTRRAHLAIIAVGLWMIGFAYVMTYGILRLDEAAAAMQNNVLVGLLLLMFAVIPNRASRPPQSWQAVSEGRTRR
jgi:hypothetical protein